MPPPPPGGTHLFAGPLSPSPGRDAGVAAHRGEPGARPELLAGFSAPPERVLSAWPPGEPLAVLWSGGPAQHARWTTLAKPTRTASFEHDLRLEQIVPQAETPAPETGPGSPLFTSGWIGAISYGVGAGIEPSARGRHAYPTCQWPAAVWARVDQALVHDRLTGLWYSVGGLEPPRLEPHPQHPAADDEPGGARRFSLGRVASATGRQEYERAVGNALEYIRAGDVYQVNLSHVLHASFRGSPRDFFLALAMDAAPRFGAYLEFDHADEHHSLCSASPELFFSLDPRTRRVHTRPMKGTRPLEAGAAALRESPKDRAELDMITDLLRNDLGRVCEFGSVRVDDPRHIEAHAGAVLQATSSISGTLREGRTVRDLLAAAFPSGSITGAPKIRAMQIIDELEPSPRGFYCGSLGYIADSGHACFNVAIRTAHIMRAAGTCGPSAVAAEQDAERCLRAAPEPEHPPRSRGHDGPDPSESSRDQRALSRGLLTYAVGAGIVADSTPSEEWRETLVKAAILRRFAALADE